MSNDLDWAILETVGENEWMTATEIASALDTETDVVERRLELLRQRELVTYCSGSTRINWTLTVSGRECLASHFRTE